MPSLVRGRVVYPTIAIPDPQGQNPKTGLRRESAALCTWLIDISPDSLKVERGYIHPDLVGEIVVKLLQLKSIPQVIND